MPILRRQHRTTENTMQILIIESTQVNYGDDRGGVHEDSGAIIDPPKDTARKLVECNRALYVKKSDDPTKDGRHTASAAMLKAAEQLAKSASKTKAASDTPPDDPKSPDLPAS